MVGGAVASVVVSGAAGAVGMLVGQLAKIQGCYVVGIAGSDVKVSWLIDELGFDGALNYKSDTDFHGRLEELCPDGIDVYFDNVGGAITDAAARLINARARIVVCGQSSQDNLEEPAMGPRRRPSSPCCRGTTKGSSWCAALAAVDGCRATQAVGGSSPARASVADGARTARPVAPRTSNPPWLPCPYDGSFWRVAVTP